MNKPVFVNAAKVRSKISAVLDYAEKDRKTVIVGRYGRPLAAIVPIKEYQQLVRYKKYVEHQKAEIQTKNRSKGTAAVGEILARELEIELGRY